MAVDPGDKVTKQLNLAVGLVGLVLQALELYRQSLIRTRNRFPAGTAMYDAVSKDIAQVDRAKEIFG